MSSQNPPQDLQTNLRALANRLTIKARELAAEAKKRGPNDLDGRQLQGQAEGYYRAALELAEVVKQSTSSALPNTPPPAAARPPSKPADPMLAVTETQPIPPPPEFENLPLNEVYRLLSYVDVQPREIIANKDNTFTGIFSRWHNMTEPERMELMKKVDARIIIIGAGKNSTHDPYIHFAFRKQT